MRLFPPWPRAATPAVLGRALGLIKAALVASLLSACPALAGVPEMVQGKVFLDANGNGKLDAGEEGIAGVRVTDSITFVKTAADGSYAIEVSADPLFPQKGSQVISLSWPSGKWPTGKWWARLDQISDAKNVHFGLRAEKQSGPFMFAHITDDHSSGGVVANYGRHFPHMAEALEFVFNTGDMGYAGPDNADKMFSDILNNGRTLPVPIFFVPGNHDYVGIHQTEWRKQHPLYGAGAYTKYLGPIRWSFDYAESHFVGIDWATPHGDGKLEGGVPPIALEFLRRDLELAEEGANLFVFVHYPSISAGALQVKKFTAVYVFGGHSHQFRMWRQGNLIYTTQIALWGAGSCGLVHVDGRNVEFLYRCAGGKWGDWKSYAQAGHHVGYCPLHRFALETWPRMEKSRKAIKTIAEQPFSGSRTVDAGAPDRVVQIELEVARGAARQVGLKLGGEGKVLEISWDGTWLICDGIRVPMPLREWEKTLRLRVIVDRKIMQMQANGMYEFSRPMPAEKLGVEAFAAGGEATIKTFGVYRHVPAETDKPKN